MPVMVHYYSNVYNQIEIAHLASGYVREKLNQYRKLARGGDFKNVLDVHIRVSLFNINLKLRTQQP